LWPMRRSGEPLPNVACAEIQRSERVPLLCSRQEKRPGQTPLTGLFIQTAAVLERRAQILDRSRIVVRVARDDPSKKNDARSADVERRPLVPCDDRRVRPLRILRCSAAQLQMLLLGNPSHNLRWSGKVARRTLPGCANILRSVSLHQTKVRLSNVLKIITGAAARLQRE